jgi:hypothetical protein
MPPFASPLSRRRTWVPLAIFAYLAYQVIVQLWADRYGSWTSEVHGLLHLTLLAGLAARIPAARWFVLGIAAQGLRMAVIFVPIFHHWEYALLSGALFVTLMPWGRRDVTLAGLAVACLGFAWYPVWAAFRMPPYAQFEPGIVALPLFLLGIAGVLARHRVGSVLLVAAAACVHAGGSHWPQVTEPGALACIVAAVLAWPGARDGVAGRLHAFAA